MKRKLLSSILACIMLVGIFTPAASAIGYGTDINPDPTTYTQTFSDVPTTHWAFTYIAELVNRGAINGYPDGLYRPNNTVSRAEFAKIMLGAAGVEAKAAPVSSYADVPLTNWASPFVETANPCMTAYRSGSSMLFKPTNGALREDIAVAVVKLKGYDTKNPDLSILSAMFSDVSSISAAAQPYVAVAVENGLLSGYPDGTFRGQGTITRSEAAAVLWRAFQFGNDDKVIVDDQPSAPATAPAAETDKPTVETPIPATEPAAPATPQTPSISQEPETTEPAEPTEPVEPNEPEPQEDYTHEMDTAASNLRDYRTMVLTNDGVVYYIDGDTVAASDTRAKLDLQTDFVYELNRDDKNYDFALNSRSAYLIYSGKNDTVYLAANEEESRMMVLWDVTDLSNPEVLMAPKLAGTSGYDKTYRVYDDDSSIASQCYGLSNGAIVIPGNNIAFKTTMMIQPASGTVQGMDQPNIYWRNNTFIAGGKVYRMGSYGASYDNDMTVSSLTNSSNQKTTSVQGGVPDCQQDCGGPDGVYYWSSGEGVYRIDEDGWLHPMVDADKIECVDFLSIPNNVWDMRVNDNGAYAIYDRSQSAIRILYEK